MSLFAQFIDTCFDGSQARAAEALGCSRSLVNRIVSGRRGITPDMARRIDVLSDGRFAKEAFVWPDAPHLPNNTAPVHVADGKDPVRHAKDRGDVRGEADRSK